MAFPDNFPYTITNGTTPDADEVQGNFNAVADYFNGLTPGQLFIANASGKIVGTTASGDVTVNSSGAFSLAAGSVGATEIADGEVGTAELANGAATSAKVSLSFEQESENAGQSVTTSYANLVAVGCVAGTWLFNGHFVIVGATNAFYGRTTVGGVGGNEIASSPAAQEHSGGYSFVQTLGSSTNVTIQVKKGTSDAATAFGSLTAVRIA